VNFLEILFDEIKSSYIEVSFFVLMLIIFIIYLNRNKIYLLKKEKKVDSGIDLFHKEEGTDNFGFNEFDDKEKFQKDVKEIMSLVQTDGTVKVPFAKAIYILKNFKNYNVFSSEDGKIIFDKLKEIIDAEENITEEQIASNIEKEKVSSVNNYSVSTEVLDDGTIKVNNPNGYTILKDGMIVKVYDANEELKKAEEEKDKEHNNDRLNELDKKIQNIDSVILKEGAKKATHRITKKAKVEDSMVNNVNELIDSISKLENEKKSDTETITETKAKEKKSDTETITETKAKEKKSNTETITETKAKEEVLPDKKLVATLNGIDKFELLDDYNIVFIIDDFEENFQERKHILLNSLMDHNNLLDLNNELILVDIDIEKETLYIDVNLFLVLFSKFYKDREKFIDVFTYSKEAINITNLKKLLSCLNNSFLNDYGTDIFKTVGKRKTPFIQRNIKYTITKEKAVSCQMLVLNLNLKQENFLENLNQIKNNIISVYKPTVNKIKMTEDNSNIVSVDLNIIE
jgi:hypothetical protein